MTEKVVPPPKPTILAPTPAPVIRDITNSIGQVSLSTPATLSARFDASSTATAPVLAPAKVEKEVAQEDKVEGEMTYEEAIARREQKELEQAQLLCSLENKDACVSTSPSPALDMETDVAVQCALAELLVSCPFPLFGLCNVLSTSFIRQSASDPTPIHVPAQRAISRFPPLRSCLRPRHLVLSAMSSSTAAYVPSRPRAKKRRARGMQHVKELTSTRQVTPGPSEGTAHARGDYRARSERWIRLHAARLLVSDLFRRDQGTGRSAGGALLLRRATDEGQSDPLFSHKDVPPQAAMSGARINQKDDHVMSRDEVPLWKRVPVWIPSVSPLTLFVADGMLGSHHGSSSVAL